MSTTGNASLAGGCGTCKLCKPSQQCQTLMPQHFMKVVESNINNRPTSFFVITKGLIFGDLISIPFDPLVDPGPYVCFNCWHSGHSHVECNLQKLRCFCQNCGRKGVLMNNCPRCSLAFLEFGMHKMELCCQGSEDDYREAKQEQELVVYLNHFCDVEEVPFDTKVDVPAENCINCLGPRHFKDNSLCDHSRSGEYCFNCGRSGVRVYNCPRCRHAYPNYVKRRDEAFGCYTTQAAQVKNRLAICEADNKPQKSSVPPIQPVKKRSTRTPAPGPFNLYFKAVRDIVVQSIDDTKKAKPPAKHRVNETKTLKPVIAKQRVEMTDLAYSINGSKGTASSGISEEYLSDEEDEDLDQIIVDEDVKPQLDEPPSEGVREFMNLMEAVKHLPIDAQSSVALQFVRKRRVLMNEKKDRIVDIMLIN